MNFFEKKAKERKAIASDLKTAQIEVRRLQRLLDDLDEEVAQEMIRKDEAPE